MFYGPKAGGEWPSGTPLIGPAGTDGADGADGADGSDGAPGADGRTVLNGTGAPSSGIGVAGDFYLNTATNTLYGPKDASTGWPAGVSLVGPAGPEGPQGPAGASDVTFLGEWDDATTYAFKDQVAHEGALWISNNTNTDSEPSDSNGDWARATQKGDTGATGSPGAAGAAGAAGSRIYSGTSAPSSGLGVDGDYFWRTDTFDFYGPKASGSWPAPVNLRGATGTTGAAGANGANGADGRTILSGTTAPSSGTGANGDFYINTVTHVIYGPKASGTWPAGVSLVGPQGAAGTNGIDGRTILNGTTPPGSGVGANGDFYLDTAAWGLYGPKAGGVWPTPVALRGPQGDPGDTGPQGPPGDRTTVPDGAIPQAKVNGLVAALAGKYVKPPSGIPKSDLAAAVQTSLSKADTALQTAPVLSVNGDTGAVRVHTSDPGAFFDDPTFVTGDPAVRVPLVKTAWASRPPSSPALLGTSWSSSMTRISRRTATPLPVRKRRLIR